MSNKGSLAACLLADRHYSRQTIGSRCMMPPGKTLVMLTECHRAVWGSLSQKHFDHAWPDSWVCTIFRNEGCGVLSSILIREAIAATRYAWGPMRSDGFITFVEPSSVRPTQKPGWCFRKAGFREIGRTKVRKLTVLQLTEADAPDPEPPMGWQYRLWGEE